MRQTKFSIFNAIIIILLLNNSCKRDGLYIVEDKSIRGYVIGKEICNTDTSKDYWLIDFTYGSNNKKVGDTLFLNGTTYTNVLKTTGLDEQLKIVGLRVSIGYKNISTVKITTTGCNDTSPSTYQLKDFTIDYQGEIR